MSDAPEVDEQRHIIGLLRAGQEAMAKGYGSRLEVIMNHLNENYDRDTIHAARWQQAVEDADTTATLVSIAGVEAITEEPSHADEIASLLDIAGRLPAEHVALADQLRAYVTDTYGREAVAAVEILTA